MSSTITITINVLCNFWSKQ